jgi:hypothetical protein
MPRGYTRLFAKHKGHCDGHAEAPPIAVREQLRQWTDAGEMFMRESVHLLATVQV